MAGSGTMARHQRSPGISVMLECLVKKELNCLGIYGLLAFLAFSVCLSGFVCLICHGLKSL